MSWPMFFLFSGCDSCGFVLSRFYRQQAKQTNKISIHMIRTRSSLLFRNISGFINFLKFVYLFINYIINYILLLFNQSFSHFINNNTRRLFFPQILLILINFSNNFRIQL